MLVNHSIITSHEDVNLTVFSLSFWAHTVGMIVLYSLSVYDSKLYKLFESPEKCLIYFESKLSA